MKAKYLLIVAAATLLASCAENTVLNGLDRGDNTDYPIGFGIYTDKATRGNNTEGLEKYHTQFVVFGTKTSTVYDQIFQVFEGDTVSYTAGSWIYSPLRFWDNQAKFSFVAIAPSAKYITYSKTDSVADPAGDYVTVDGGYTLVGTNLQNGTGTAEINFGFTGEDSIDADIMTAQKITDQHGATHPEKVDLLFSHVLAKLNITIRKTAVLDQQQVYIKKVEITGLDNHGVYAQKLYSDSTSGWISSNTDTTYVVGWKADTTLEKGLLLPAGETPKYFVESLIMPQDIRKDTINAQELHMDYWINNQIYKYNLKLRYNDTLTNQAGQDSIVERTVFDSFKDRNKYTIKLTIDPEAIIFNIKAQSWSENDSTISVSQKVNL